MNNKVNATKIFIPKISKIVVGINANLNKFFLLYSFFTENRQYRERTAREIVKVSFKFVNMNAQNGKVKKNKAIKKDFFINHFSLIRCSNRNNSNALVKGITNKTSQRPKILGRKPKN